MLQSEGSFCIADAETASTVSGVDTAASEHVPESPLSQKDEVVKQEVSLVAQCTEVFADSLKADWPEKKLSLKSETAFPGCDALCSIQPYYFGPEMCVPVEGRHHQQSSCPWYSKAELGAAIPKIWAAFGEGNNVKAAEVLLQPGFARQLSHLSKEGSRLVQKAIEVLKTRDAVQIALQFKGHVVQASESKHGNQVIEQMIRLLPQSNISFIIDELSVRVDLACNVYACRSFIKLLQYGAHTPAVWYLMEKVLQWNTLHVATDKFGHHFFETVLELGTEHHRNRCIIDFLLSNWSVLMNTENGPYVLAKVLLYGEREDEVFLASCLRELNADMLAMVIRALPQHEELAHLRRLVRKAIQDKQRPAWKTHKGLNLKI